MDSTPPVPRHSDDAASPDRGECTLTQEALHRLLQRLAPDREAAAREYEVLRRRLLEYFGRRGVQNPELLADEVFDRVAHRLEDGETIERVRNYFYGVAWRVHADWLKRRSREAAALKALSYETRRRRPPEDVEARIACLQRCLRTLPGDSRELIDGYYEGPGRAHLEGRKALAERLGISYSTLKTRAFRVRAALEGCLKRCLSTGEDGNR